MNAYKFRAECLHDVIKFMEKAKFQYDINVQNSGLYPDVIVEISTKESLNSIVSVFQDIPDTHVIIETIQSSYSYTGLRQ